MPKRFLVNTKVNIYLNTFILTMCLFGRQRNRDLPASLIHPSNACTSQGCNRQKPRTGSSIWFFHDGDRESTAWVIAYCLPGCTCVRSCDWEQSLDLTLSSLIWDANVNKRHLNCHATWSHLNILKFSKLALWCKHMKPLPLALASHMGASLNCRSSTFDLFPDNEPWKLA